MVYTVYVIRTCTCHDMARLKLTHNVHLCLDWREKDKDHQEWDEKRRKSQDYVRQ